MQFLLFQGGGELEVCLHLWRHQSDDQTIGISCAARAKTVIYMVAPPGTYLFQFYTLFTVFKASPVKGFEGTGIPYSL